MEKTRTNEKKKKRIIKKRSLGKMESSAGMEYNTNSSHERLYVERREGQSERKKKT